MTKEEAQKEFIKLMEEDYKRYEAYYKKHPSQGGLDGPVPEEIRKLKQETMEKIQKLKDLVDE